MASLSRRPLRVGPAATASHPGDAVVDLSPVDAPAVELFGEGRWSLRDATGRDHTALLGEVLTTKSGRLVEVVVAGWRFELAVDDAARASLVERAQRTDNAQQRGGPLEVRAIIPGRIMAISVAVGDAVGTGQQLLVVEAMKMQNEVRAPRAGTVERIAPAIGDTVDLGDLLIVIG